MSHPNHKPELTPNDAAAAPTSTVFVARAGTRHFDFLAIGASRAEAIGALLRAWRAHARQTGADPRYLTADDIDVIDGPCGQAFRDGSPYPTRT